VHGCFFSEYKWLFPFPEQFFTKKFFNILQYNSPAKVYLSTMVMRGKSIVKDTISTLYLTTGAKTMAGKIFVTGATGNIGDKIVNTLSKGDVL
jgi:hypothetical protein